MKGPILQSSGCFVHGSFSTHFSESDDLVHIRNLPFTELTRKSLFSFLSLKRTFSQSTFFQLTRSLFESLKLNWKTWVSWKPIDNHDMIGMTNWQIPIIAKNIWRIINNTASIWLWCARLFVLGHYMFLGAHSSLLGTTNVRGQISEHNEAYFTGTVKVFKTDE